MNAIVGDSALRMSAGSPVSTVVFTYLFLSWSSGELFHQLWEVFFTSVIVISTSEFLLLKFLFVDIFCLVGQHSHIFLLFVRHPFLQFFEHI